VESLQPKPKKYRPKRQMTAEQKQAAVDRLAKARAERLKNNPPAYKNIHPDVLALPDDHPWSHKNVKNWIKTWKTIKEEHSRAFRRGDKTAEAKKISAVSYINNMETYLKTNVWLDMYWGEDRNKKVKHVATSLAYYHTGKKAGQTKRSNNTFYSDLGFTYRLDEHGNT